MNDFTFVMLTYNQRKYVVEHLESIKYQVEHFGAGRNVHFVLCDDASKDDTAQIVSAWLEDHPGLFASTRLIVAEKNAGITKNNLVAMKCPTTERFNVLAGDDMYYRNDVMSANDIGDFVVSPVIYFADDHVVPENRRWAYKYFMLHQGPGLKKYIAEHMKYCNQFEAPGVFYTQKLVTDEFCAVLDEYTWLEDAPLWSYHLNCEHSTVDLHPEALVLYRVDSGASNNTAHERRAHYLEDVRKLDREVFVNKSRYPAWRNPYVYRAKLERLAAKYILCRTNKHFISFANTVRRFEQGGQEHLDLMRARAGEWMSRRFPE